MPRPRKERRSGVYGFECLKTGWVYIGSSKDMDARQRHCFRLYNEGRGHNRALQYAWSLHGAENFQFFYLEECSVEHLRERELHWLSTWDGPLFNILRDARRVKAISAEESARRSDRAKSQHAAGSLGRQTWRGGD